MSRYELRSRTPTPTPAKKATARKSPVVLDEGSDSGEEEEHEVHELLDNLAEQQHLGSPEGTAHVKAAVEKIEEAVPYDLFVSSYLPCTLIILAALATTYFYWHQFDVLIQLLEPLSVPAHANKHWSQGILPRISILDFFGSIVVCDAYRKAAAFPKHPVETLVACTLLQFGGTTLAHVFILGQAPSWVASHTAWPALALAWWLTFCCPRDIWHKTVMSWRALRYPIAVMTWISTAHAVTSWGMEKALSAQHSNAANSLLAAILCGGLSACGGGIMGDALSMHAREWGFKHTPAALKAPTIAVQRAFLCSAVYYYITNPHGYLQWPGAGCMSDLTHRDQPVQQHRAAARAALALGIFVVQTILYWVPEADVFAPLQLGAKYLLNVPAKISYPHHPAAAHAAKKTH